MRSKIQFANEKVEKAFEKLRESDEELYKFVLRAFKDIEENVFLWNPNSEEVNS